VPLDPSEPRQPGRIIVPGGEFAPETDPADPAAPRIVLPPGVEAPDDGLPEYPRLRALEMIPVREGDQDYLVVSDPLGVLPAPVALRIEALELMQLLDGSASLNELVTLVARESKDIRAARFVRDFVGQLDRLLLLDSPRFQQAWAEVRGAYHALEVRQAALEGISYPADPADAAAFLARHFEEAEALRAREGDTPSEAPRPGIPRALLVPHLDPRRAGAAIARGYLELDGRSRAAAKTTAAASTTGPLRLVVLGVGHALLGELFALTRKHFETPFGKLACDTAFVDAVASRLGESAYRGELAHRDEHSLEFQAVYLKYRFRDRALTLVPVLCAGFHGLLDRGQGPRDSAELESLIAAIREAEKTQGGDTAYVAAVDLSHVGTRFGDPRPDDRTLREIEERDHAALEAARRGDADGWHQEIAAHHDATRICGWGATYVMLRCAEPGEGRLLHYEQSQESTGSAVSIATLVWP
jgi:AmmeMemoRadiSam system protein B